MSVTRGVAFGAVFNLLMLTCISMRAILPWPRTALEFTAYAWGFIGCAIVGGLVLSDFTNPNRRL